MSHLRARRGEGVSVRAKQGLRAHNGNDDATDAARVQLRSEQEAVGTDVQRAKVNVCGEKKRAWTREQAQRERRHAPPAHL